MKLGNPLYSQCQSAEEIQAVIDAIKVFTLNMHLAAALDLRASE